MSREQAKSTPNVERCPLCKEALADSPEPVVTCSGCQTRYHDTCGRELGGCATLGCPRAGKVDKDVDRTCPECGEWVPPNYLRGRHCRCGCYLHEACIPHHEKICRRAPATGTTTVPGRLRRLSEVWKHSFQQAVSSSRRKRTFWLVGVLLVLTLVLAGAYWLRVTGLV